MDVLAKIMGERLGDVAEARRRTPPEALRKLAARRQHHSLRARLEVRGRTHIIAEMKKASPSAGLLCADYQPVEIGRAYAAQGAAGLSILTEPRHFLGSAEHLMAVRATVGLPILRKDFLADPYQVLEAAAWGADVVLLIVAALTEPQLVELHRAALALGLEVLAEAHTEEEVERALQLNGVIIGINSRNLKTLKTDLEIARRLARCIPVERLAVAESGISRREEIVDLEGRGFRGFLIGEALLASGAPGGKLRELMIAD